MELEKRKVTLELPPEVWDILDGANELANLHARQNLERWLSHTVMQAVGRCLDLAIAVKDEMSINCPGSRA
jgi:hypothetical protein